MKKIAVIGIGNVLLRDDGVGVHVINELEKQKIDENIELIDAGTSIFELLDVFSRNDIIIIVDSLKGGYTPGTIYKLTPKQLEEYSISNVSLHDVQALDILRSVNLMGYYPDVTIIGVEPKEITYDMNLSPLILAQVDKIIEIVMEEIKRHKGESHA